MVKKSLYVNVKRKGVSPVVATIIIVGLVLASAAMVFFVVLPMLTPEFQPILNLDRNQSAFYDYDHDGKCDFMVLRLENFGVSDTLITVMTITATKGEEIAQTSWVPLTGEPLEIKSKDSKNAYFYAEQDDIDELESNAALAITVFNDEVIIGTFTLANVEYIPGDPITIDFKDSSLNPISEANINFYYSSGEFAYSGEKTDGYGLSTNYLYPGKYYARATDGVGLYSTDIFLHPGQSIVPLQTSGGILEVKVLSSSVPLAGITTYLYDLYGNYLGQSAVTDDEGIAKYSVSVGNYKVRAYYLGAYYHSPDISYPDQEYVEINVGGGTIYCRVIDGGNNTIAGIRVYLFTATNSYTGRSATSNSSGLATFTSVSGGNYKFRADYSGYQIWSDAFGAAENSVIDVNVGNDVFIQVNDGAGLPISSVRVYLFTESNSYTGKSATTNSTGFALIKTIVPVNNYKVRVDYAGYQIWSEVFEPTHNKIVNVSVGGSVFAHVVDGDGNPIVGIRTYLFTSTNSYTGKSAVTNATGYAEIRAVVLNQTYKIRADYSGYQIWSGIFEAEYGLVVDINVGGGVYAHVFDGSGDPLSGVRVYLFTESGSYTGKSSLTNATGIATFNVVPLGESYKFRADYSGYQIWSAIFESEYGLVVDIDVGGGIYAKVLNNGVPIVGVRVYLFTESGTYTGKSNLTDANGIATFSVAPLGENYRFRADYSGQHWSEVFTAVYGLEIEIDVSPGSSPLYVNSNNVTSIVIRNFFLCPQVTIKTNILFLTLNV